MTKCDIDNLASGCKYNAGGIVEIRLLDFKNFQKAIYKDDKLFDELFIENIYHIGEWLELDSSKESLFTETYDDGYNKTLETSINGFDSEIEKSLLISKYSRFVVAFKNYSGVWKIFGIENGAKISYSSNSGQIDEGSSYNITINCLDIYPTAILSNEFFDFEINQVDFVFKPDFDNYVCQREDNKRNGYKVAKVAYKVASFDSEIALDRFGYPIEKSKNKQVIMILADTENPNPSLYEIIGTYNDNDSLIGGYVVIVRDTNACKPEMTGTITTDKKTITLTTKHNKETISLYSQHPFELKQGSEFGLVNYRSGSAGVYEIEIQRTNFFGNGKIIYRNIYSTEEIEIEIKSINVLLNDGQKEIGLNAPQIGVKRSYFVNALGGSAQYITNVAEDWIKCTQAGETLNVEIGEIKGADRKGTIHLVHKDDSEEKAIIEVNQEFRGTYKIEPADYLLLEATHTPADGDELFLYVQNSFDTITLPAGGSNKKLSDIKIGTGYNEIDNKETERKYFKQAGTNSDLKKSILIDLKALKEDSILKGLKDLEKISIFANWNKQRKDGNIKLKVTAFFAGEMVEENREFKNIGGFQVYEKVIDRNIITNGNINMANPQEDYTEINSFEFDAIKKIEIVCNFSGGEFTYLNASEKHIKSLTHRNVANMKISIEGSNSTIDLNINSTELDIVFPENKLITVKSDSKTLDLEQFAVLVGYSKS